MRTVRENYLQLLFSEITELNGENTEEALNMVITESIIQDRIDRAKQGDREALIIERLDSMIDNGNIEKNGAYIYNGASIENLTFDKYDTIADAVKDAIKMVNAQIICDGCVITYDALDNDTAYYVDDRKGKVMIVELH